MQQSASVAAYISESQSYVPVQTECTAAARSQTHTTPSVAKTHLHNSVSLAVVTYRRPEGKLWLCQGPCSHRKQKFHCIHRTEYVEQNRTMVCWEFGLESHPVEEAFGSRCQEGDCCNLGANVCLIPTFFSFRSSVRSSEASEASLTSFSKDQSIK